MSEKHSPQEQITHRINEIYSLYSHHFLFGFHTLLWHILFTKTMEEKTVTFYPIYENGLSLALADNTGGYIPTPAVFKEDKTFNNALQICLLLAKEIFNQTPAEHTAIIDLSFSRNSNGVFGGFKVNE